MKRICYPLLALLLGAAGYILRIRQLSAALSPTTGMPLLHHPITYALIGVAVGGALLLLILSFSVASEAQDWYSAYHAGPVLQGCSLLAALGFAAGTGLIGRSLYLTCKSTAPGTPIQALTTLFQTQPFLLFFGLLMICATLAILFMVIRNGENGSWSLAPLLPAFTSCVWLVLTYHTNASNPSVLSFVWQVLAVVCATLAWYYTASFAFQSPRPQLATWLSLVTVFLCCIALADSTELYQKVILAATALWFLLRSILLIGNSEYSGRHSG